WRAPSPSWRGPMPWPRRTWPRRSSTAASTASRASDGAASGFAERQPRVVLDLLQRELRIDVGHALEREQLAPQEALVFLDAAHDHAQQVIGLAGHGVAFEHFREIEHGALERLHDTGDVLL